MDKVDTIRRAVLQPNPVLMWSFSDNLNYKLEFEAPFEVTALSFCPYDSNILIGGTRFGQIIIWDLQGRVQKFDTVEVLTTNQAKYRIEITDFLSWTICINESILVPPAIITNYNSSPKGAITAIYWMGRHFYLNSFGKIYHDPDLTGTDSTAYKYFITCALDGSVTFWNLSSAAEKKGAAAHSRRELPKVLLASESPYKGKTLKPTYCVQFSEPLTSIIADTSILKAVPMEHPNKIKTNFNFRTTLCPKDPEEMNQTLVTSSFYGRIERLNWLGVFAEMDAVENITTTVGFARVHDGLKKKSIFSQNICLHW